MLSKNQTHALRIIADRATEAMHHGYTTPAAGTYDMHRATVQSLLSRDLVEPVSLPRGHECLRLTDAGLRAAAIDYKNRDAFYTLPIFYWRDAAGVFQARAGTKRETRFNIRKRRTVGDASTTDAEALAEVRAHFQRHGWSAIRAAPIPAPPR